MGVVAVTFGAGRAAATVDVVEPGTADAVAAEHGGSFAAAEHLVIQSEAVTQQHAALKGRERAIALVRSRMDRDAAGSRLLVRAGDFLPNLVEDVWINGTLLRLANNRLDVVIAKVAAGTAKSVEVVITELFERRSFGVTEHTGELRGLLIGRVRTHAEVDEQ